MPDDRWVSVEEAARRLGVSDATVRRRVRAGTLEGERLARPQGEVYRVRESALPPDSQVAAADTLAEEAPTTDMTSLLRERLLAADNLISTELETISRYVERIANLERDNGRLQSEVSHLTEQLAAERARADAAEARVRERAERPWWRKILGG
jgi:excisionase family DNA binding protein